MPVTRGRVPGVVGAWVMVPTLPSVGREDQAIPERALQLFHLLRPSIFSQRAAAAARAPKVPVEWYRSVPVAGLTVTATSLLKTFVADQHRRWMMSLPERLARSPSARIAGRNRVVGWEIEGGWCRRTPGSVKGPVDESGVWGRRSYYAQPR